MGDSRKGESLAKGIEVMTAETRGELWVWVFSPAGKQFPNGIFYTRDEAERAIKAWGLSGTLTHYWVGGLSYQWAVDNGFYKTPLSGSSQSTV